MVCDLGRLAAFFAIDLLVPVDCLGFDLEDLAPVFLFQADQPQHGAMLALRSRDAQPNDSALNSIIPAKQEG